MAGCSGRLWRVNQGLKLGQVKCQMLPPTAQALSFTACTHSYSAHELAATFWSATICSWMCLGTTSYFSSFMLYCARPLVMPRSVDT